MLRQNMPHASPSRVYATKNWRLWDDQPVYWTPTIASGRETRISLQRYAPARSPSSCHRREKAIPSQKNENPNWRRRPGVDIGNGVLGDTPLLIACVENS